jgi:hypothetical protein
MRIDAAKERDADTLGKSQPFVTHFPSTADEMFGPPIIGPDDVFVPPAWLLQTIQELVNTPVPTPRKPPEKRLFLETIEATTNREVEGPSGLNGSSRVKKITRYKRNW